MLYQATYEKIMVARSLHRILMAMLESLQIRIPKSVVPPTSSARIVPAPILPDFDLLHTFPLHHTISPIPSSPLSPLLPSPLLPVIYPSSSLSFSESSLLMRHRCAGLVDRHTPYTSDNDPWIRIKCHQRTYQMVRSDLSMWS